MRNWSQWRAGAEARRERASRAAEARWAAVRAARVDEPVRETRVVELTIRDSHRPLRILQMSADESERGWGRWDVCENGVKIGRRRFGRRAVAELLARSLQ